jgi:hypothetical protein
VKQNHLTIVQPDTGVTRVDDPEKLATLVAIFAVFRSHRGSDNDDDGNGVAGSSGRHVRLLVGGTIRPRAGPGVNRKKVT